MDSRSVAAVTWLCLACTSAPTPQPEPSAPPTAPAPAAAVAAPDPAVSARLRHGAELYARMCAVCHGATGEGYKADQAPAIGRPTYLASVSDAFLRTAVEDGRSGSTMSPWSKRHGGPLSDDDITALVAHMRSWHAGPLLPLDERPRSGDAEAGAKHYAAECARCHGPDGMALTAVRIGHHDWLASASDGLIRHALREGRPGTTMESFRAKLGDQGIEDVLAHVRRFAEAPKPAGLPAPAVQAAPLPLGKVPLNPQGPEPKGFQAHPGTTKADVVHAELARGARMAILDARPPPDYAREHIAGAVSVPYYDPTPYLDKLPKHAWLVSYCACPHAESRELARKLSEAGFSKVTVLDEGLGHWKGKGYPTQTGPEQGKP